MKNNVDMMARAEVESMQLLLNERRDMLASKKAIILDSANRIDEYINKQK